MSSNLDQIEIKHRLGKVGAWLNRQTDFPEDRHLLCRFAIDEFFKLPCIELYMANEKEGKFKELAKEARDRARKVGTMKTFKQWIIAEQPESLVGQIYIKEEKKRIEEEKRNAK